MTLLSLRKLQKFLTDPWKGEKTKQNGKIKIPGIQPTLSGDWRGLGR